MPRKKSALADKELRFIDDVAMAMMNFGLPQAAARIYGYLLVQGKAASLDQIGADLDLSKSTLSVSARMLEKSGMTRRLSERGSKRALYEVVDTFDAMLTEQNRKLLAFSEVLRAGERAATSAPASRRIKKIADFCFAAQEAQRALLKRLKEPGRSD